MKSRINNLVSKLYTPVKYLFSSGISFVIDQLLFNILIFFYKKNAFVIVAKLIARAISSLINFFLNSKLVFSSKDRNSIFKYYALVMIQALISSLSIYILKNIFTELSVSLISICVDIIIFIINYVIQKEWIFK